MSWLQRILTCVMSLHLGLAQQTESKAERAVQAALTAILPQKIEDYNIGGHQGITSYWEILQENDH